MMEPEDYIKRYESLKTKRYNWESLWQDVAELVLPRSADFITQRTEGERRDERLFDSTAPNALEKFSSIMQSMLTPSTQRWHSLSASDESLMKDQAVREWFESANNALFRHRYRPAAGFSAASHEVYTSLGAFGTGAMQIINDEGNGIRYRSHYLGELTIDTNEFGVVDTVMRCFKLDLRNAISEFGETALPSEMLGAGGRDSKKEFEFIHCVKPRTDYDPDRVDAKGMKFESVYISKDYKEIVKESGFRTMPYAVSRYTVSPMEVYGRGPAIMSLSDIRMLNTMSRHMIRAAHKLVDPPLLLHDDGILGGGNSTVDLRPAGLNYGGVSPEGRQLIQPFQTGARPDMADSLMEQRRQSVRESFLVNLFQILVETPEMTATEAMIRSQEKGQLLGPTLSRQQNELLDPMIERELDLLMEMGKLPEMPAALLEAEGDYTVGYDSPMTRMMQAEEIVGLQRTIEATAPFLQVDPTLMGTFDVQQILRDTSYINGVPSKWLKTEEEVAEERAAQAKQQQEAQALEAAPQAASAMRDVAAAQESMSKAQSI